MRFPPQLRSLKMEYGPTRTLPKSAVRGVLVHLSRGIKLNWFRVQAVTPGTPTTVVLYQDQAPRGRRKIKGHFYCSHGRLPYGGAPGWAEAYLSEVGRAPGAGPTPGLETIPGMGHYCDWSPIVGCPPGEPERQLRARGKSLFRRYGDRLAHTHCFGRCPAEGQYLPRAAQAPDATTRRQAVRCPGQDFREHITLTMP